MVGVEEDALRAGGCRFVSSDFTGSRPRNTWKHCGGSNHAVPLPLKSSLMRSTEVGAHFYGRRILLAICARHSMGEVRDFNYIPYFKVINDGVARVMSVAEAGRRPGYWLGRLYRP